jgi:hypothetical protein
MNDKIIIQIIISLIPILTYIAIRFWIIKLTKVKLGTQVIYYDYKKFFDKRLAEFFVILLLLSVVIYGAIYPKESPYDDLSQVNFIIRILLCCVLIGYSILLFTDIKAKIRSLKTASGKQILEDLL